MNPTSPTPSLYALLVGINDYQSPVRPLTGCLNDVNLIKQYLTDFEGNNFDLKIETLTDSKANRDAVISHFKNHLIQATADDVVLFYYSGHGAQEKADTDIWRFEPDQKLETLVLHDSVPDDPENIQLFADKELRHLLHLVATLNEKGESKAGSPHIVVITDCCHSGENTRSQFVEHGEDALPRMATMRSGDAFPIRPWERFCFSGEISQEDLRTKLLEEIMPQSAHISLAACQSNEKAWEVGGTGVFTTNLIQILKRSQGTVTYHDLRSRIRYYIKGKHRQVPQIYAVGDEQAAYKTFLGREAGSKPMYANVQFNDRKGWVMDMGAIHGISQQVAKEIDIIDEGRNTTYRAAIERVYLEYTKLTFPDGSITPAQGEYKGLIQHFLSAPISIYLNNKDLDEEAEQMLRQRISENNKNVHLVEEENGADYTVQIMFGYYAITKPTDPNRPLVLPELCDEKGADHTYQYLQHISQFEYVKQLENTAGSKLNPDLVEVEFFQIEKDGSESFVPVKNDYGKEAVNMILSSQEMKYNEMRPNGAIKIKLTNRGNSILYAAVIYLADDFQSFTKVINGGVQLLETGKSVWAMNGKKIGLSYDRDTQILNLPFDILDFKIIISQKPFDVNHFELDALPTFDELVYPKRSSGSKDLDVKNISTDAGDAWTTRLITLRVKNPNHNLVSQQELSKWLESAGGPFVEGIYLTYNQPFGGGEQVLKEQIMWKEDEGERGLKKLGFKVALSLGNKWYRKRRKKLYKKTRRERPELPVIVSEGDSWFLHPHPGVKEIIDHLVKHYAIRSLGAGGDTLENYYNDGEMFKALRKEKADFLLLSGGGNDILGEEVKELLADQVSMEDVPEGERPERFLNHHFQEKIDRLGEIYRLIFVRVQREHESIPIICHGYDYILPNPNKGWFATHIKDKVKRRGDQKALADYLIDSFNVKMIEVTSPFPNVHYLDNRRTVRDFLWYDEIHPNSTGFFDVALKFRKKLNELRNV